MNAETISKDEISSLKVNLKIPYTLTAGHAMGTFIAELAQRRILGSRCEKCSTIRVPAQDFCGSCGEQSDVLVEVPETGTLEAWTVTDQGTIGLVLLDGTDVAFLHRILSTDQDALMVGTRVEAVWSDEMVGNVLDLAGFSATTTLSVGAIAPAGETEPPVEQLNYTMELDFEHSFGFFYGTLFDGIKNDRRIRGVRCPECRNVLLPPRPYCEACFVPTVDWVDIPDSGVVKACSVVHIEFTGQRVPPPYVYAEIILDGTSTRLIHTVGGLSAEDARAGLVRPGSRVKAVWSDRRTGSLTDIDYFELVDSHE
jgi:uncharacterized OB-fold protein